MPGSGFKNMATRSSAQEASGGSKDIQRAMVARDRTEQIAECKWESRKWWMFLERTRGTHGVCSLAPHSPAFFNAGNKFGKLAKFYFGNALAQWGSVVWSRNKGPRFDSVSADLRLKAGLGTRPELVVLGKLCSNEPNNPPDKPAGFGCWLCCPRR